MLKLALVDATYLCHVALHSTGRRLDNGTIFGFLGLMETLQDRLNDHRFIYCFDSPHNLRKGMYPQYKGNRKPLPEAITKEFNRQREIIQHKLLPDLDCSVYCVNGYEADDCIAQIAKADKVALAGQKQKAAYTLVSGDEDLFQLLAPNVRQWAPVHHRMTTYRAWCQSTGITPDQWVWVKATAGCTSDNVKGIESIGPARAVDFLLGKLNKKYSSLISSPEGQAIVLRNLPLVKLPLAGMPLPTGLMCSGFPDQSLWNQVSKKYGMPSRAKGVKNAKG